MAKKLFSIGIILAAIASLFWFQNEAPQISASFEVASIARDKQVPFKVTFTNLGQGSVEGMLVVARAGDSVQTFTAPNLEPGEVKTMEGVLEISTESESTSFWARVIGKEFSFRSDDIAVVIPNGLGGGNELLYSQVQQGQQLRQSKIQPQIPISDEPIQLGTDPVDAPPQDLAFGNLESVDQTADVQHLISQVQLHQCSPSRQTLEVYQEMGNSEADEFLVSSL